MGKRNVILSGVTWTIIQNLVNVLYGIVSVPFLLNYFGKEEYGLIGLAMSVNVYIHLLDLGMTNSNVRFFSEYIAKNDNQRIQQLFSLSYLFYFCIGLLNSIILFVLSFYVDIIFKISAEQYVILRNLLFILALNSTFSWISVCFDQFLRANELIDWIKKRSTFLKLLQFAILLVTIVFKLSIEVYFFCYIFVLTIILPWTLNKVKHHWPGLKFSFRYNSKMMHIVFPYAISLFSFSIFQFLAFNFRPLFLGNMSGPSAVADFNIMSTIAAVVTVFSGSFMQVLLPIVTKMRVASDRKSINKMVHHGVKYVNIFLSIIVFLIIISINEIFELYVGEDYSYLSKWMILWLLVLLLSHRNVMTSLVFTETKLKSVSIMSGGAMLLSLICYYLFIPKYGVGGVVLGYCLHEIVHTSFYYIYFIPKRFTINTWRLLYSSVLPTWFIFSLSGLLVTKTFNSFVLSPFSSLFLKSSAFCILILFVIWLIIFNSEDKVFVKSFLKIR